MTTAIATISAVQAVSTAGVSAEHLSKIFRISHEDSENTIASKSQINFRMATPPSYEISSPMISCCGIDGSIQFTSLKLFFTKKAKSTHGNIGAQIYVSDKGFVKVYPVKAEREFISALQAFVKDVDVPAVLVCDGSKTQTKKEVKNFSNKIGKTLHVLENETQWADRDELYIFLIKESTRKDTSEAHSPLFLWDYVMEQRAIIHQVTSKDLIRMNGTKPHTATFFTEADILNICHYGWYEWVYYRDQSSSYPNIKECLGHCLGPDHNEVN